MLLKEEWPKRMMTAEFEFVCLFIRPPIFSRPKMDHNIINIKYTITLNQLNVSTQSCATDFGETDQKNRDQCQLPGNWLVPSTSVVQQPNSPESGAYVLYLCIDLLWIVLICSSLSQSLQYTRSEPLSVFAFAWDWQDFFK